MPQIDCKSAEIDGATYKVFMLDPLVATDLVADVAAILLPSLAALGNEIPSKAKLDELLAAGGEGADALVGDSSSYERAAVLFFQRFNKAKQRELIQTLAGVTRVVEGEKEVKLADVLAIHFRGRLGSLYKWLGFAMKVQLGDFFASSVPAIKAAVRGLGLA